MARVVTQMRSCGTVLSTSVQAERQGPSMTTRWPDWRTIANSCRYEPTSPPGLDTMRRSARAATTEARSSTSVMAARAARAFPPTRERTASRLDPTDSTLSSPAPMNIDAPSPERVKVLDRRPELRGRRCYLSLESGHLSKG